MQSRRPLADHRIAESRSSGADLPAATMSADRTALLTRSRYYLWRTGCEPAVELHRASRRPVNVMMAESIQTWIMPAAHPGSGVPAGWRARSSPGSHDDMSSSIRFHRSVLDARLPGAPPSAVLGAFGLRRAAFGQEASPAASPCRLCPISSGRRASLRRSPAHRRQRPGWPGRSSRPCSQGFAAKYPNITVNYEAFPPSTWTRSRLTSPPAPSPTSSPSRTSTRRTSCRATCSLPLDDYMAEDGVTADMYYPALDRRLHLGGRDLRPAQGLVTDRRRLRS